MSSKGFRLRIGVLISRNERESKSAQGTQRDTGKSTFAMILAGENDHELLTLLEEDNRTIPRLSTTSSGSGTF